MKSSAVFCGAACLYLGLAFFGRVAARSIVSETKSAVKETANLLTYPRLSVNLDIQPSEKRTRKPMVENELMNILTGWDSTVQKTRPPTPMEKSPKAVVLEREMKQIFLMSTELPFGGRNLRDIFDAPEFECLNPNQRKDMWGKCRDIH